jgi:hypothetical protein
VNSNDLPATEIGSQGFFNVMKNNLSEMAPDEHRE